MFKSFLYYIGILLFCTFLIVQYQEYTAIQKAKVQIEQELKKEKDCLKTALYHEARGEGEIGMLAVANVIHNRYMHPNYPDTYCDIINQRKQFSYTLEGKPHGEALEAHVAYQPERVRVAYQTAEKIADDVVEGRLQKFLPENALWYTTTKVKNYWTKTKKVAVQIGNHKFYKE